MCILNGMDFLNNCIHLYIGCETNKGRLIGMINDSLFIQSQQEQSIAEYSKQALGKTLFLYLRKIGDISGQQSKELIEKGFSIGRPSGYSFSNEAIVYLLGLSVDLFGLINSGMAKDINGL
jgi:hypothetical protein